MILYGKAGRGKTHLAVAIGYRAIQNGFENLCTTAAELIEDLSNSSKRGQLHMRLRAWSWARWDTCRRSRCAAWSATWRLEYPIGKVLYESGWIDAPRVSPNGDLVAFLDHPIRMVITGARLRWWILPATRTQ